MNLLNELKKVSIANHETEVSEYADLLELTSNQLSEDHSKDLAMLRHFGTSENTVIATILTNKHAEALKGEHLKERDVADICNRYALRCLPASMYRKQIPMKVLNELRKFLEDKKIDSYMVSSNLFVIAPHTHFNLESKVTKDPVLLYRLNDSYKVIDSWGSDFSFTRRIYGMICSNRKTIVTVLYLCILIAGFVWGMNSDLNKTFNFFGSVTVAGIGLFGIGWAFIETENHVYNKGWR